MRCDLCRTANSCQDGKPCVTKDSLPLYRDETDQKVLEIAAAVESEFYADYNRIQEIVVFAKRMGYKKLGLAFCVALNEEAAKVCEVFSQYFEIASVCCKVCGIAKTDMRVPSSDRVGDYGCNPIEQARILEESGAELNLLLGLCVGHDALFIKHSKNYVVPVAVKDRVTGHNPLAAIYASAVFKKMKNTKISD